MFGWLFGRGGYDPGKDTAYRYHNGKQWVDGDPMELLLLLNSDESFGEVDLRMSAVADRNGAVATLKIVAGVRKAFSIPSHEVGGLSASACIRLLTHFWGWLEKKSAATPTLATSATQQVVSAVPSVETSNLESTSTETGSPPEGQTQSPSVSLPPSEMHQLASSPQ